MKLRCVLIAVAIIVLSAFSGCDNVADPEILLISITIGDAARGGPSDLFYLLPPLVEEPEYSGIFDASLSPVVSIPDADIEFTTEVVRGTEYIRVVPEDEHYIVNWHTEDLDLGMTEFFRISFTLEDTEIGYIEIRILENGDDIVFTGDELNTMIQPGRTLPIKFRIEQE